MSTKEKKKQCQTIPFFFSIGFLFYLWKLASEKKNKLDVCQSSIRSVVFVPKSISLLSTFIKYRFIKCENFNAISFIRMVLFYYVWIDTCEKIQFVVLFGKKKIKFYGKMKRKTAEREKERERQWKVCKSTTCSWTLNYWYGSNAMYRDGDSFR